MRNPLGVSQRKLVATVGSFLLGAAALAGSASAQSGPTEVVGIPPETTPIHQGGGGKGGHNKGGHNKGAQGNAPVVINWQFKKHAGFANLTVNPDGSFDFSGKYTAPQGSKSQSELDKGEHITYDVNVMLALKSPTGAMLLFHWVGPANGTEWSKTGHNAFLKGEFDTLASKHEWAGTLRLTLTPKGKRNFHQYCKWLANSFGQGWIDPKTGKAYWGWSPDDAAEYISECE